MPFSKVRQNRCSGILIIYFFFSKIYVLARRNSWAGGKPLSLQRPHGNKPGYLDSTSAAKPLLRFSVHFWAEEDFEDGCGRGEGILQGTHQHKRGSRKKRCEHRVEKQRRDLSFLQPSRRDREDWEDNHLSGIPQRRGSPGQTAQ